MDIVSHSFVYGPGIPPRVEGRFSQLLGKPESPQAPSGLGVEGPTEGHRWDQVRSSSKLEVEQIPQRYRSSYLARWRRGFRSTPRRAGLVGFQSISQGGQRVG